MQVTIQKDQHGLSLRNVLRGTLALSNRQVNILIDSGQVLLNQKKETHGSVKLKQGDIVSCNIQTGSDTQPTDTQKLELIYEDEHFMAFNKPAGIPSQKTKDLRRVTMESLVQKWAGDKHDSILLHRLDRDTSGILLFAKDEHSACSVFTMFIKREIKKEYLAIVHGHMAASSGVMQHYLSEAGKRSGKTFYQCVKSGGAVAITEYRLLQKSAAYSLLQLNPGTGRTHQLRVQLAHVGCPIVGDTLYGPRDSLQLEHQMLHARKLQFDFGKTICIEATLPQTFINFSLQAGLSVDALLAKGKTT